MYVCVRAKRREICARARITRRRAPLTLLRLLVEISPYARLAFRARARAFQERLQGTLHDSLLKKRQISGPEGPRGFATPWAELLIQAIDLCETVDWLHHGRPGVVLMHRDLKPQNMG